MTEPSRRRHTWWWLIAAAILIALMLVPLTLVPPSNQYLYWFQAYVMGRTSETRAMVILPPQGYTGHWTTYHLNLAVDSEMEFVAGKLQGRWQRYDVQSGMLWWSGEYAENDAVGEWYWYDSSGRLIDHKQAPGFHDPTTEMSFMLFWWEF